MYQKRRLCKYLSPNIIRNMLCQGTRQELPLLRRTVVFMPAAVALPAWGIAPTRGTLRPWYVVSLPPVFAAEESTAIAVANESTHRPSATLAPAERLMHWSRRVLGLVVKYQQNPLRAARSLAYVNVAMHDAWFHATRLQPADPAFTEIAVHRAASLVAEQLYANETPGQFEAQFAVLTAALRVPPSQRQRASRVGQHVADALIARSLRDGAGRVWPLKQRPADFAGIWQPTYPMYAVNPTEGFAPQWRPWLPAAASRYEPPTAWRPGSEQHLRETREVLEVTRALTDAQKRAANDWNLEAGSVTPGGVWTQLALQELLRAQSDDSAEAMRSTLPVLAALGVALHDAFVGCWRVKLRDWSERPITAVRRELDAGFAPLLVTPGFPSYVSGHSTISAAAAVVLGHFWPAETPRFERLAQEAAMSRLWGGIHFRSDNDEGYRLGQSIGQEVVARLAAG